MLGRTEMKTRSDGTVVRATFLPVDWGQMKKRVRQVAELASQISSGDATDRGLLERYRQRYGELTPEQRLELFHWLSDEFEINLEQIEGASGENAYCLRVRSRRLERKSPRVEKGGRFSAPAAARGSDQHHRRDGVRARDCEPRFWMRRGTARPASKRSRKTLPISSTAGASTGSCSSRRSISPRPSKRSSSSRTGKWSTRWSVWRKWANGSAKTACASPSITS